MPSIGAVTNIIVSRRINEAIKATFDEKTQPHAHCFLNLSLRGGNTALIAVITIFGIFLTTTSLCVVNFNILAAMTIVGMISLLALYWAVWRRKKARRDLDALVASNPEFWLPIQDKLKQIVLDAGKFEDGVFPSQVTRIVK